MRHHPQRNLQQRLWRTNKRVVPQMNRSWQQRIRMTCLIRHRENAQHSCSHLLTLTDLLNQTLTLQNKELVVPPCISAGQRNPLTWSINSRWPRFLGVRPNLQTSATNRRQGFTTTRKLQHSNKMLIWTQPKHLSTIKSHTKEPWTIKNAATSRSKRICLIKIRIRSVVYPRFK